MALIYAFLICILVNTDFMASQETDTQSNVNKIIEGVKGLWQDFTSLFSNKYKAIQDFAADSKEVILNNSMR